MKKRDGALQGHGCVMEKATPPTNELRPKTNKTEADEDAPIDIYNNIGLRWFATIYGVGTTEPLQCPFLRHY